MSEILNLNKKWLVRGEDLSCGPESATVIISKQEGWLQTDVPCDIRQPLLAAKIIREPLEGLNCFDSEWVEKRSWWFLKHFSLDEAFLAGADSVELVLESIDYGADIFLNGQPAGFQLSTFYPFRKNVKRWLQLGDNTLLIRLTTGLERVTEQDMQPYIMPSEDKRRPGRGDRRKGFLRKPQYTFGWDWNPRVASCGIMKDVWLESHRQVAIRWAHVATESVYPAADLSFQIEIENFHPYATCDANLLLVVSQNGITAAVHALNLLLRSGLNPVRIRLQLADARLWWPNGMGGQNLYQAAITLTAGAAVAVYPAFEFGIRTVEIDQTPLNAAERLFAFKINGVRLFCKGGDWIPADSLYGRISDERYATLVGEAKNAGFNMLRIWGGGLYERETFYRMCDRQGILLWQDFMFACSEYPDDQDWFLREVERELEHQTRQLGNHPALALWSGNNENHWGFAAWWPNTGYFGARIYNYLAPAAIQRNCPEIPYWNSSPYGGAEPNGSDIGDRHHWGDCMMNPDIMKRIVPEEYDRVTAKFISEYGYIGPSKRSSVERYFGGSPVEVGGKIWQHHTNTFEADTVAAGIRYHYADPEKLDIDQYLLYAGLCQGLMYGYSLESFRFKADCWGSLFWMYNDCWGETGWTIIDYYLIRKISFYFVKRAFAPVKLILRSTGSQIQVAGINDSPEPVEFAADYGFASYDGRQTEAMPTLVRLPPYSRQIVLSFTREPAKDRSGVWFIQPASGSGPTPAILRTGTYRQSPPPPAWPEVVSWTTTGAGLTVTVRCAVFAHAVHFNLPDAIRLSDDYFDLLPGESRQVTFETMPGIRPEDIHPVAINC